MTERELIEHIAALIDDQAARWPPTAWSPEAEDAQRSLQLIREKAAAVRSSESIEQVRALAEQQIPAELENLGNADWNFLDREALLECESTLRDCLRQVSERELLGKSERPGRRTR